MRRVAWFLSAWLVVASLLSACQATKVDAPPSEGLRQYVGEGFSLQLPANAWLEVGPTERVPAGATRIVGPQIWIKPGDADWSYRGAAYELEIRTYDNPAGLDVETWARDYILTTWQRAVAQGEPAMGPPVSEDGVIFEDRVGRATVAGQAAFRADFFAGDSYRRTFFLVKGARVVALSFYDYPVGNQPLASVQQDVYELLLSTFRWKE